MASDLKSFFDRRRVERIADGFVRADPSFPRARFVREASEGLEELELLDRGRHIAAALAKALPADFLAALDVLLRSLGPPLATTEGHGMEPFHYHPHTVFVAEHGLDHPEASLAAQRELTRRYSCEFSVRPFLERHPAPTMAHLWRWTKDEDPHVRRLVSEGTRPRLPWAPRLAAFQRDPTPVLALLEALKDDPSAYVRRSVANNLNDISKDHPGVVVATCARWSEGATDARRKLVHHALRTLVRAGHPDAIRLVGGGGSAADIEVEGAFAPRRPRIGGKVRIEVGMTNTSSTPATVVASLRVHFVKARGGTAPRSFKLPTTTLPPGGRTTLVKTVSLRQQTTRTHYPGPHRVEVVVNGVPRPLGRFTLAGT